MLSKQPENLLLDQEGNIKVSDFGLSVLKKVSEKKNYVIKLKYSSEEHWAPINNFINLLYCSIIINFLSFSMNYAARRHVVYILWVTKLCSS